MTDVKTPLTIIVGDSAESEQAASYIFMHWLLTDYRRNPITFRDAEPGEQGVKDYREVIGRLSINDPADDGDPDGTATFDVSGDRM